VKVVYFQKKAVILSKFMIVFFLFWGIILRIRQKNRIFYRKILAFCTKSCKIL